MTATTSKLGADMLTDTFNGDNAKLIDAIKALLDLDAQGALVPHGVGGHARTMLASAAVRLTRQPAAIEVECNCASTPHAGGCPVTAHVQAMFAASGESAYGAVPLGKEASKPAATNVAVKNPKFKDGFARFDWLCSLLPEGVNWGDELDPNVLDDILSAASPAAPSVEQDERGAFEAWLKQPHPNNWNDCNHPLTVGERQAAHMAWFARAASTSANVAQGAEAVRQLEQANGSWLDVSEDAYNSTEPEQRRIVYSRPQPAQTALTDDARDAATVRLAALKDAENIARLFDLGTPDGHAIADAIRKLAAAQSASGDTQ